MSECAFPNDGYAVTGRDAFLCSVLSQMGAPRISIELTEGQIDVAIANAVRVFRNYESQVKAAIALDTSLVANPVTGIRLPDEVAGVNDVYQNTTGASGINTLFTAENYLYSQGYYDYKNFDLVSWQVLQNWIETKNMVLGTNLSYNFNKYTKVITFTPSRIYGIVLIEAYVHTPMACLWNNDWIRRYTMNEMYMMISNIRGKYGQTQLLGGGHIEAIMTRDQYEATRKELVKELIDGSESSPVDFYVG
jgi:hypothetical protein